MINERHEKALEAAVTAYKAAYSEKFTDIIASLANSPKGERSDVIVRSATKAGLEAAIPVFLQDMDAVICEATPKAFLVSDFADGAYLTRSLKAAEKSDHHFDALHPALPNHFTNGE